LPAAVLGAILIVLVIVGTIFGLSTMWQVGVLIAFGFAVYGLVRLLKT
jgi:hypothetical protein